MQLKFITAAVASMMIGNAIAGPIPQPIDEDDTLALYARAEQAEQAQQAQQAEQAAQAPQAEQGEQAKQGDQWLIPGGINAGVYSNGYYNRAYFRGLGINAYAAGYGYPRVYGNRFYGNRLYGQRRGWYGGYRGYNGYVW